MRKGTSPALTRERVDTPDGDFLDLDWLDTTASGDAPLLVLFHGLEGSSRSHYARSVLRACRAAGWRAVVPHFRGCSGEANRLPRAYHSGDSEEIDWILRTLRARHPNGQLFAVGVSLGGNALLKWLGERSQSATALVEAAAALCPPLDLTVSGPALGRGLNTMYTAHFLRTLKPKALAKLREFPGLLDADALRAARTLYEFDNLYTAPVHGFTGVEDYWKRASSKPWLGDIAVPTLLLVAANDPFVPPAAWPNPAHLPSAVRYENVSAGGHVGFLGGPWPGHIDWLPQRVLHHFRHGV